MLLPPPFLLLWQPSTWLAEKPPFWKLAYVSLPRFSWQVSDWSSLDMHTRGGEGGGERPSDPTEPIQGCIPLHPLVPGAHPTRMLFATKDQWRANSIMSCLLGTWYCATLYSRPSTNIRYLSQETLHVKKISYKVEKMLSKIWTVFTPFQLYQCFSNKTFL